MIPIFLHRFDKPSANGLVDTLVAFVGSGEFRMGYLASVISAQTDKGLAPDQLIVLARSDQAQGIRAAFADERETKTVLARLRRSSIALLTYDGGAKEVDREWLRDEGRTQHITLEEIYRQGATSIFRENGGFVEPNASYHFANPSGRHTDRFMRLSNILVRNVEIAFLAVAAMRHVPPKATQAYIDTPSLYAVTSAINEQWRSLSPLRPPLMADNFRSYEGIEKHEFEDFDNSVVLISASSSGGLASRLGALGFEAESIVHVLYLGPKNPNLKIAVDLCRDATENPLGYTDDRELYEAGECRMCDRGSKFVPLLGDQFDIRGPQPEPLVMRQPHAPKTLAPTMSRLSGSGTFGISTGDRQYQADAGALLAASGFLERLEFISRSYVPGSAEYCVIPDDASRSFAEMVITVGGAKSKIITRSELDGALAADTGSSAPVLVCAPVIGAGRVLLEVSRDLRQLRKYAPIVYIVGVSKPASEFRRETLRRNLIQSHHPAPHALHVVEEIVLPGPPTPNPWQEELRFLGDTRDIWPEEIRAVLAARHERLLIATQPLRDELFLPNATGHDLRLQPGFAFWPTLYPNSQADVFFTMSAILQHLRDAPEAKRLEVLRSNWLQQTLISPENFGRFNDGVIQSSILRGALAAELDYRDDAAISSDMGRIIRRIVEASSHPRGEAAAEFLLALATGRLRLRQADLDQIAGKLDAVPPLVTGLMTLIERRRHLL